MKRPKFKIGQRVKLENGLSGHIMSTRAIPDGTYLGHASAREYFARYTRFVHEVAYEDGDRIRTIKIDDPVN